jgi:glycine cleavage system H protein
MSHIPENLKYTRDHEWLLPEADGTAMVGITDYAQSSLGDVTFVELPDVGAAFAAGDTFGVVESVKAASDLYMPVGGTVVAVNSGLLDTTELVNSDPYGAAWLVRIAPDDAAAVDALLDAAAYRAIVG